MKTRQAVGTIAAVAVVLGVAPAQGQDVVQLQGIVIEGERTERLFEDTATSVFLATAEDLETLPAVQSTNDVLKRVPNLSSQGNSTNSAPAIRGIDGTGPSSGTDAFLGGTRPRLNYTVDGRTLSFNEAVFIDGSLWDAQQVEVYRGPQSTLQGRNSIAGVIAVKTADPTFEWEGKARLMGGNFRNRQFAAALGGPIVEDILAVRFSAEFRGDQSFVDYESYDSISDPEDSRFLNLRGKVLFQPTGSKDFQSLLTVTHTDAYAPQADTVVRPFDKDVAPANLARMPRFQTKATGGILDTNWKVADGVKLSALATATDIQVDRFAPAGLGGADIDATEYSAEPRIKIGDRNDMVSGFAAAYVFSASQDEALDFGNGGAFTDDTLTRAVFGEINFRPTRKLNLNFGARYEEEDRDRVGTLATPGPTLSIDYHETFKAFMPRATVSYDLTDQLTVGTTAARGYNAGGAGIPFFYPFTHYEFDEETVNSYEGFVRTKLFGDRVKVRANVFYNDYTDLQVALQQGDTAIYVVENIDKVTTYGAEFEAKIKAHERLDLFFGLGLLKSRIDEYSGVETTPAALEGNELARAPAFSLTGGFVLRPIDRLSVSVDGRYSDTYYSDAFNRARGKVDPYFIANAEIGYEIDPAARLFVSATNLFDSRDMTSILFFQDPPTTDAGSVTQPRRIMAGIDFKF